MMERQQIQPETSREASPRFAELRMPAAQNELVATVHIGEASLEVYRSASADVAAALCKALSHAE